ncbi:MAG: HAD family hydrolase [Anaerolineae bacterium]|nr:HAD family hydrolase [Anaerolineae bacterium]
MPCFDLIAFDADDTLWHNERLYHETQALFARVLSPYADSETVDKKLYQTESRNLSIYGYGIKAFALSMIETAIEVSQGAVNSADISAILNQVKHMLSTRPELLPHTLETIQDLSRSYPLMMITKGDLFDQENKISHSGLGEYFKHIEILSEKHLENYRQLLERYQVAPQRFLMVGNSMRSDILPILEMGGSAVYIPYHLTWVHEMAEPPAAEQAGFYELEHMGLLPDLLKRLNDGD